VGLGGSVYRYVGYACGPRLADGKRFGFGQRPGQNSAGDTSEEVGHEAFGDQLSAFSEHKGWAVVG
jgi:hypothetical protein